MVAPLIALAALAFVAFAAKRNGNGQNTAPTTAAVPSDAQRNSGASNKPVSSAGNLPGVPRPTVGQTFASYNFGDHPPLTFAQEAEARQKAVLAAAVLNPPVLATDGTVTASTGATIPTYAGSVPQAAQRRALLPSEIRFIQDYSLAEHENAYVQDVARRLLSSGAIDEDVVATLAASSQTKPIADVISAPVRVVA